MSSSVAAVGEPTLDVATHAWPRATGVGPASSPDQEELRDFCSLLSLADRVLIASPDRDATAARLLSVVLEDLGFVAQVVDARTIHRVQRYDTVVAVCAADQRCFRWPMPLSPSPHLLSAGFPPTRPHPSWVLT